MSQVTTPTGSGVEGAIDGSGIEANFNYAEGVAVDSNGKVFVANGYTNKIRKAAQNKNASSQDLEDNALRNITLTNQEQSRWIS